MRAAKMLVVSLNPAIDCEWMVPHVRWEEKNNILAERRWAGGKGANVARWLRQLGGRPELLVPLGGTAGDELAGYLKKARVPCRVVPIKGETRVNVIVTSNSGQLRLNPLGPMISKKEWGMILGQLRAFCREHEENAAALVILSGALPRGLPDTAYAQMIDVAHEFGIEVCLDCDGAPFAAAVKRKPWLVKPNIHELAQWWTLPIESELDARAAYTRLSAITGGWVLLSRGGNGALLWHSATASGFVAKAPQVQVRNTVGAGDALLAGFLRQCELSRAPEEWLRYGVAAGTACVQNEGGCLADENGLDRLTAKIKVRALRW